MRLIIIIYLNTSLKNIDASREEVLAQLRRLLAKIVIFHLQKSEGSTVSVQNDLYQILLMMIHFFKILLIKNKLN